MTEHCKVECNITQIHFADSIFADFIALPSKVWNKIDAESSSHYPAECGTRSMHPIEFWLNSLKQQGYSQGSQVLTSQKGVGAAWSQGFAILVVCSISYPFKPWPAAKPRNQGDSYIQ